jgi:Bacterial regulatory helix-turn-helix protein, lysR family
VINISNTLKIMELRQIRSFLSVAETLHFGCTAEMIHLSQPALSLQIRALEDEIGVRLFERNRRKTAAGASHDNRTNIFLILTVGRPRSVIRSLALCAGAGPQARCPAQWRPLKDWLLPAVEAACTEALSHGTHSADVIINILTRRRECVAPISKRIQL